MHRSKSLFRKTYSNVEIIDEKSIEEPHGGTESEEKWESEGHVLHALSSDHSPLQDEIYLFMLS